MIVKVSIEIEKPRIGRTILEIVDKDTFQTEDLKYELNFKY